MDTVMEQQEYTPHLDGRVADIHDGVGRLLLATDVLMLRIERIEAALTDLTRGATIATPTEQGYPIPIGRKGVVGA